MHEKDEIVSQYQIYSSFGSYQTSFFKHLKFNMFHINYIAIEY